MSILWQLSYQKETLVQINYARYGLSVDFTPDDNFVIEISKGFTKNTLVSFYITTGKIFKPQSNTNIIIDPMVSTRFPFKINIGPAFVYPDCSPNCLSNDA